MVEQVLFGQPLPFYEILKALDVIRNRDLRGDDFVADGIHLAGWDHIVDHTEPISAEGISTSCDHRFDRHLRRIERIGPRVNQIGGQGPRSWVA